MKLHDVQLFQLSEEHALLTCGNEKGHIIRHGHAVTLLLVPS